VTKSLRIKAPPSRSILEYFEEFEKKKKKLLSLLLFMLFCGYNVVHKSVN